MDISEIYNKNIRICMKVDKPNVVLGDILTYIITIENSDDEKRCYGEITNLKLIDLLPEHLEFINGTIEVNDCIRPELSISCGINLNSILIGEKKVIKFKVRVLSGENKIICNQASITYVYNFKKGFTYLMTSVSNKVSINIQKADVFVNKKCNVNIASIGDTVTYKVILKNSGTLKVVNVIFRDSINKQGRLIRGSFKVNNNAIYVECLNKGVCIGNIDVNDTVVVEYSVKVVKGSCKGNMVSSASVEYDYIFKNCIMGSKCSKETEDSTCDIRINLSTFKEMNSTGYLSLSNNKVKIKEINNISANITINDMHVISSDNTYSGREYSSEYKLIINGELEEIIEYTGLTEEQAVYSAYYSERFSTFIVLPKEFEIGTHIQMETNIENIYYKVVNECRFYKDITFSLVAKLS